MPQHLRALAQAAQVWLVQNWNRDVPAGGSSSCGTWLSMEPPLPEKLAVGFVQEPAKWVRARVCGLLTTR
jgi:hypothetical protein